MIFMSISHPVCWRGSAKATHLLPVKASVWIRLERHVRYLCHSAHPIFVTPPFQGWLPFFCTPLQTAWKHIIDLPFLPGRNLRCHPDQPKRSHGIFWRSEGNRVSHFLCVALRSDDQNLTVFRSRLIPWESAVGKHLIPVFCTAR